MGQQSVIYSFVARGTVILAEYTDFSSNFTSIASQCLHKLPATNNKFTYNCDGHTFNYLVDEGFSASSIPFRSSALSRHVLTILLSSELCAERKNFLLISSRLKEHMQYCVGHAEDVNKLAKVKAQVNEVKGVMMENIEKVLDSSEEVEILVDKTESLCPQVQDCRSQGTTM